MYDQLYKSYSQMTVIGFDGALVGIFSGRVIGNIPVVGTHVNMFRSRL